MLLWLLCTLQHSQKSELRVPFRLERGSMMARFKKDTFLLTKDALSYGPPILELDQKSCYNFAIFLIMYIYTYPIT